jgi:exodeoxyribonuclease-3
MKIATWNVNSLRVRLPQVLAWIASEQPDVLALQETKLTDEDFPREAFTQVRYHAAFAGQKTYNGVAIISRTAPEMRATGIPGFADPQRRVLRADIGGIDILNLYVPNGAEVGSDKYDYKLDWLSHLQNWVRELLAANPRLIVLGDFNIAPENEDVHDPAEWEGKVLFSEPERTHFRRLLEAGLVDCFRLFEQPPGSFTWWDYRAAGFRRNRGLRIDHILAGPGLAAGCRACRIDVEPRRAERPSDHAPVVAEFTTGSGPNFRP